MQNSRIVDLRWKKWGSLEREVNDRVRMCTFTNWSRTFIYICECVITKTLRWCVVCLSGVWRVENRVSERLSWWMKVNGKYERCIYRDLMGSQWEWANCFPCKWNLFWYWSRNFWVFHSLSSSSGLNMSLPRWTWMRRRAAQLSEALLAFRVFRMGRSWECEI